MRSKSGVFASCCALQIKKKAKMFLSLRAPVIRARGKAAPAFDFLRLLRPYLFLDALKSVLIFYRSESAIAGAQMVDTLCDTPWPFIAIAKVLRNRWGVFPLMPVWCWTFVRCFCRPIPVSRPRCSPGPCLCAVGSDGALRCVRGCARRWDMCWVPLNYPSSRGCAPRRGCVSRPFPISRVGRLENCAGPGGGTRRCRVVMIVRGAAQIACRLSDLDKAELVWLLRACRGAGSSRTPHGERESVKTAERRMVRGSPKCGASVHYRPGEMALGCTRVAQNAAGPRP